ncbi:MAG: HD domain-containing protein [Saccharofermentanales bacterium]|jgi:uncharacterized protein
MMNIIEKTKKFIRDKQMGESSGHDWWHTLRVYQMAVHLAGTVSEPVDMEIVELAALLHDIEDWKFHDGNEDAGPDAAENWLESSGVPGAKIRHIRKIIRDLSYKGSDSVPMTSIEGMIVQDADRLDAVGAIGIARCFAFGAKINNEIFNPEIPARVNISGEEYKDHSQKTTAINHFFEKLFVLKDLYNLEEAKKIGLERHLFMKNFVKQLLEECKAENTRQYELLSEV